MYKVEVVGSDRPCWRHLRLLFWSTSTVDCGVGPSDLCCGAKHWLWCTAVAARKPKLVSILCQPCQLAGVCHDQVYLCTKLPGCSMVPDCTRVPTRVYGVNWWHDLDSKTGVPACNTSSPKLGHKVSTLKDGSTSVNQPKPTTVIAIILMRWYWKNLSLLWSPFILSSCWRS